jgi:hypothetical protein
MPVFNSGGDIVHSDGSDIVWSTTRRPALLLPDEAVTLINFDFAYPDFSKSNAYGFDIGTDGFGATRTSCASYASINPQEWDSGLSFVCNLPASANYFEVEVLLTRIVEPSTFLGEPIPKALKEGQKVLLDGGSAIIERIGPIVRLFRFEKSGAAVYLRRKQSVTDAGNQGIWTPGNAVYSGSGGKLEGFTYGGSPNAWPAYLLQAKGPGGSIHKERGAGADSCSLTDTSDFASTWRGTVIITPGYIEP